METLAEDLTAENLEDSVTVKTLCCGHKEQVERANIEDGKYRPYSDSWNYIECPECGNCSGLYTLNRASVKLLNMRGQRAAQSRESEPESSNMLDEHL